MTIYDKGENRGFLSIFALVSFAVLALPCLLSGAGRGSGSSGGFRAARGFHTNAKATVPVRDGSLFRLQSGGKPISVFRVRDSERSCTAFTVVDSSMETDSLMDKVE
jgi:hypothetical protein